MGGKPIPLSHPEALERSGSLEGGFQIPPRSLEPSFEARFTGASQDEGLGGPPGSGLRAEIEPLAQGREFLGIAEANADSTLR